jgi:hypothetical protein
MSEDSNVKITLSAVDRASPVIRRVIGNMEELHRLSRKAFDTKSMNAYAQSFTGAAKAQEAWAASLTRAQQEARAGFDSLQRHARQFERSIARMQRHDFGPTKQALAGWRNLRSATVKDANTRARLERQIAVTRSRILAAHDNQERRVHRERLGELRRRAAEEDRHERQRAAAHRTALSRARELAGAPSRMANRLTSPYFTSPAFAATMISGSAVVGARSLIGTARTSDTAGTYARIHGFDGRAANESRDQASLMRRQWAVPQGYAMGITSAEMITAWTEATKSGIADSAMAKATAELGVRASKTLGLDLSETIEQMGYAIAGEYGSGRLQDVAGIHRLINTATSLASQSAANPAQMMSFLRTGLGAGSNMGLTQAQTLAFGALAVESGAEGQQAARMLSTMGTRLSELSIDERETRAKGTLTASDREFLRAPRMLGYLGGWGSVERMLAADPGKIFEFINSFSRIDDDAMRKRMMHEVFGQEFVRFIEQMLQRPASSDKLRKIADEAYGETQGKSFIDRAYGVWAESMEFELGRIASAWTSLADALGRAFKPLIGDVAAYAGLWLGRTDDFAMMFTTGMDGLVDGLLGYDSTFQDLLQNLLGDPSTVHMRAQAFYEFFRGFGDGIRQVAEGFMAFANLVPGIDAGTIGKMAGSILALSFSLNAISPFVAVIAAVGVGLNTLGAALQFLAPMTAAGGAFAAVSGSVAMLGLAMVGLAKIASDNNILQRPDFSKSWHHGLMELLDPGLARRIYGDDQKPNPNQNTGKYPGFAHGGSFTVGGSGGTDSKLVQFWATPGELVNISTPNQAGANGMTINLRTDGIERRLGDMVMALYRLDSNHREITGRMRVASLGNADAMRALANNFTAPTTSAPSSFGGGSYGNLPGGGRLGGTPFGPNFYTPNLTPPGAGGSYQGGMPGNDFFDAIIKAEGTARDGNPYNEVLVYGAYGRPSKPLTQMTLDEVKAFGMQMRQEQYRRGKPWNKTSSASGAFQIVGTTMMDAARALGMDPSKTKFDEKTQRQMALWIARQQGLGAWEGFKHNPNERSRAASALAAGVDPNAAVSGAGAIGLDGVPIKGGIGGQAFGGGGHAKALEAMAQELVLGGIPGQLNRFTAFNDHYHAGTNSKHAKGLAADFTIKDSAYSAQAAEALRNKFRVAGLTDDMFKVIDEYRNPSGRSTGGHIHAQFQSEQAALLYQQYVDQQRSASQLANSATPAEAIRNVPMPAPSSQRPGSAGGAGNGVQVTNHFTITGNTDVKSIADQVQRRITESMNWRTHDVEHDLA